MTLEALTPRPAQEQAIRAVLRDHRHLCRAEVGAGKTLIGVEAVIRSHAEVVLVVAPLNTRAGWERTFARQGCALQFRHVVTLKDEDTDLQALIEGVHGVYFMGWELFRRQSWWQEFPISFVIYDEVHRGQNRKSSTHKAMLSVKADYRLALSGTPWGNHIRGSWAILKSLWPDVYPAFWTFVTKYLKKEKTAYAFEAGQERVPGAIWADIPSKSDFPSPFQSEPIVHRVEVDLSAAQQKVYDRLEKEGVAWLEENVLATQIPADEYLRLMETTLAVPSIRQDWIRRRNSETGEWEKVWGDVVYFKEDAKSSKIDALLEILEDLSAGGTTPPVLVFTHSRKLTEVTALRLQEKGYRARMFVGGMSPEERQWKLDAFGKEYDVLVATIATVGEGTDGLQDVCSTEVWLSVSDNGMLNTQARGRLSRPGQAKTVNRYLILARNTIETTRQLPRMEQDAMLLESSFPERTIAA